MIKGLLLMRLPKSTSSGTSKGMNRRSQERKEGREIRGVCVRGGKEGGKKNQI